MDAATRDIVRLRALDCCEYCRRKQTDSPLISFHLEHAIAIKHGGNDGLDNLALACPECNRHKGSNIAGIDPDTGQMFALFHPRNQQWNDHFIWMDLRIKGLTAVGRTTIRVLKMNSPARLRLRRIARLTLPPN